MKPLIFLFAGAAGVLPATAQVLTNAGTALEVQTGATLFVGGSFLNQAGGSFTAAGLVQLTGDFTSTAALGSLSSPGLLRFSGTQDQTLSMPAGTTLTHLTVANSGAVGHNRLLVPHNLTVNSVLTLGSGLVRTDAAATIALPVGAEVVGEAPGRYVQGNLQVVRNVGPGSADFSHGVVLDGAGQALGLVRVTRTAGLLTPALSYGTGLGAATQSIDRIWTVVANQPVAPVLLTLSWLPDDDHGQLDFSQARLWQSSSSVGPWSAVGAPSNAAARSLARSVATLGTFTISNAASPLPVELVEFTAEPAGTDALLRWTTAQEQRNDRFEVEASSDGRTFRLIGTVAGQGTSSRAHAYQFRDVAVARYAAGVVYYRLRQLDHDGTAVLSPVRTVAVVGPRELAAVAWPTPCGTQGLTLSLRTATAGAISITLRDALGRVVLSQTPQLPAGTTELALPEVGRLPPGVYFFTIRQAGRTVGLKVIRS